MNNLNKSGNPQKTKPNLFRFATSELSQDGVLCWLAEWGNPTAAEHDPLLHRLGQAFLKLLLSNHGLERLHPLSHIEIKRQYKNIDILVIIDKTFALLLEDKAGTSEHSDQLRRYICVLQGDGFSEGHILPVYIQTGEQSSYRSVTAAGYRVVHRRQLIELIREYLHQGGSDSIARDFHDHLTNIERAIHAFRTLPLADWDGNAWNGFYSEVQRVLGEGDWDYESTPSGGFFGYSWHRQYDSECEQYMLLQEDLLCFKIFVNHQPAGRCTELRSLWLSRILAASREMNFSATRPTRLGWGDNMTVAVVREYRIAKDGTLDLDATLNVLRRAAEVLDRAVTPTH